MLKLLRHLLNLEWWRAGASVQLAPLLGSQVWYAEFAPSPDASPPPPSPRRRPSPWWRGGGSAGRARKPPTIVLLHGLGASSVTFHPVIGALRRGYRVIVPDLPGCGASRPPAGRGSLTFAELLDVAEALVERVAPSGAYLAGNSMGGWIAAKLAARRPDLARGIALINPGGPALRAEDWEDFGRVLASEDAAAVQQLVSRLFHRPPPAPRLWAGDVKRMLTAPSVRELVGSLAADDFLSEEELARVDCPAVLIWGESDRFIPDGCRRFFLEKLPRVRYEPVPDCGHCPQLECPRRTAEILLDLPRRRRRGRAAA